MKIYFIFILTLSLSILRHNLFSEKFLEMNSEEKNQRREKLKKFNRDTFVNRSNEKADEDTRKNDLEAGKKIANNLVSGQQDIPVRGILIRRYAPVEEGKYGGDVVEFTDNISFGHVNSIIRIITGYIKEIYNYTQEDAELLSLYMVYYNLKHRQDNNYLTGTYNEKIVGSVSKDKVGLGENFDEWKGQTQMLIPLEKNILKGGGVDIATFELEDQVNTELDAQKDESETKKRYSNFQNKKIKTEREESEKRLQTAKTRQIEIVDKKKQSEEKYNELLKDPEKNKNEISKIELEKQKINEEISKIEEEKSAISNKAVQVKEREEMRKIGITSEKEYKEAVKNNKLPEVYIDPSSLEVKTKGNQSQEYAQKNKSKNEPYSGAANSVGIPNWKNKNSPSERDQEKQVQDSKNNAVRNNSSEISANSNSKVSQFEMDKSDPTALNKNTISSTGQSGVGGTSSYNKDQNSQTNNSTPGNSSRGNININSDLVGGNQTSGQNNFSGTGSQTQGIGGINSIKNNSQNTAGINSEGSNQGLSGMSGKDSQGLNNKNTSSYTAKITPQMNNSSSDTNSKNSISGTQFGDKNNNNSRQIDSKNQSDQFAGLNPKKGKNFENNSGNTPDSDSSNKGLLKYAEEPKKKVVIKVINDYNLAFHAAKLNISAREFIKSPNSSFIVIGRKLPLKNEDLGLFLLNVEDFSLKSSGNNIILHKNSPLLYYYDKIIVYEKYKNEVYLTQLNMDLELDFRSPQPIDPDTSITIEGETVNLLKFNPIENSFQTTIYNRNDFKVLPENN